MAGPALGSLFIHGQHPQAALFNSILLAMTLVLPKKMHSRVCSLCFIPCWCLSVWTLEHASGGSVQLLKIFPRNLCTIYNYQH